MMIKQRLKVIFWSAVVILLPIIYGVSVYDQLPATMATHWGINNQANGFMPRALAVFGLPIFMLCLQIIMMAVTWLNSMREGPAAKFERVLLSIMPILSFVLYITTIMANLGHNMDIWRIAMTLVGLIFIAIGNYLPVIPADLNRGPGKKKWRDHPEAWTRYARRLGYVMVGGGVLCILSILATPVVSVIVLVVVIVGICVASFSVGAKEF